MKSSFLIEAQQRGFIHQSTNLEALDNLLASKKITAYIGYDPTGDSLHVGNLVSIMMLRLLQKHGHKVIALVGGATAKVGDPSGKDATRQLLSDDRIQSNIDGIKKSLSPFLSFKNEDCILLNNYDWFGPINYINFLRDIGSQFSINRMLAFDSVKLRLDRESSLSFLEFNYMILQAYDFLELNKKYDCVLQMGGSDQWGNIVNGVELIRKKLGKEAFGLTCPLITTSSGAKMGKTAEGAVWLNADRVSPYDYWQFWRNTEDKDVIRFLKLFTDMPVEEIEKYNAVQGAELNDVKKILADAATTLAHGRDVIQGIHQKVAQFFSGSSPDSDNAEVIDIHSESLAIIDILSHPDLNLGLSRGEIRRLITGKGIKANQNVIESEKTELPKGEKIHISVGKKKHAYVRIV